MCSSLVKTVGQRNHVHRDYPWMQLAQHMIKQADGQDHIKPCRAVTRPF